LSGNSIHAHSELMDVLMYAPAYYAPDKRGATQTPTNRKRIYVAGPLFSLHERRYLEELVEVVSERLGVDEAIFFLPHRDAGDVGTATGSRPNVFHRDISALDESEVVIALLDGPEVDAGTAAEVGYAFAKNKRVFGVLTDWRYWKVNESGAGKPINNMIWGICKEGISIYKSFDDSRLIRDLKRTLNVV
jgi:nucleoside 2-deoxyribosyltransferase